MNQKMILKNKKEIVIEEGASLNSIQVLSADKQTMISTWEAFTEDNLSAVEIHNSAGAVIARYTGLVLVSETSTVNADGSIITSYNLREKSDIEKRLEALEALEAGQAVQDGAIMDVADILSVVVDQTEGGAQ